MSSAMFIGTKKTDKIGTYLVVHVRIHESLPLKMS